MAEPTFFGDTEATSVEHAAPPPSTPQAFDPIGSTLKGNVVFRHASGSYIRFTADGDIIISPAPGKRAMLGIAKANPEP